MDVILILLESALISTFISAIVAWFSGDRWVAKYQLKREHSLKLKDSSIKTWINDIDKMCPTSTEYDHIDGKVCGEDTHSYEYLPYGDFIRSHMTSGHSEIHNKWKNYKLSAETCADIRASILNDIRKEFEEISLQIDVQTYYYKQGISRPKFYTQPFEIAKAIMREKLNRFEEFEDWIMGEPSTDHYQVDSLVYPRLFFHNYDLALTNDKKVDIIRKRMYEILDDREYHTRFVELNIAEGNLAIEKKGIVWRLRELVEYIELGNNLEGRCSACDKSLYKKSMKSARESMKLEVKWKDALSSMSDTSIHNQD